MFEYLGIKIEVFDNVYNPSDDSFLMAENLLIQAGETVLELGTGCGLISILAALKGAHVFSVDISNLATNCTKFNSDLNNIRDRIHIITGDLLSSLKKNTEFDWILFNPPYLPADEEDTDAILEKAWVGGQIGNEIIFRFLDSLGDYSIKCKKIRLIFSDLSKPTEILEKIESLSYSYEVLKVIQFFFERIYLIELTKK